MRWWTAYRDGLVEPTTGSLVAAVVIALAGLAGMWLGTTDARLAKHPGAFALNPMDSAAWATAEALALAAAPAGVPRLVLVGDGALREALVSTEDLAERVAAAGIDAPVHVVSAWAQTVEESAAVADLAPVGRGLLVLAAGPVELAGRARGAGLGIGDGRTRFVATRAYRSLLALATGPVTPRPHLADAWQGREDASWPTAEQARPALDLLGRAAKRAERRGYDVALLQTPADPEPDWLSEAAADRELTVWRPSARPEQLAGGRYLLDEGERVEWTEALVEQLVVAWGGR